MAGEPIKSDEFTETIASWVFAVAEFLGNKKHDGVEPGKLYQHVPKTFYGQFERFVIILAYIEDTFPITRMMGHFWILIGCSIFGNNDYCYDNIFADLALESGHPYATSIYAYLDLFTWKGWLEGFGYMCLWLIVEWGIKGVIMFSFFIGWFAYNPEMPFCSPGEIKLWGIDLCKNKAFELVKTEDTKK